MDTQSSYEDHSEAGGEDPSANDNAQMAIRHNFNHSANIPTKSRQGKLKTPRDRNATGSRKERWERLQSHYNDQYLNLLKESSVDSIEVAKDGLGSTKIGLTDWSSSEKEQFFLALSRRSKGDVRGIASCIRSKSELQVYEYLQLLEDEDRNRHLYAKEVSNVSQADIPAAAELSVGCEALLEKAADALTFYQDKYDRAIAEQTHHDGWLIDHVQAEAYDKSVDRAEDVNSSEDDSSPGLSISGGSLLRLSSCLSLTERIFMNSDPSRNDNNWITHAAHDEMPAITQGAISDLQELAIYQLRKLMQTSIFCAESRIRSTRDRGYTAKALVKEQDVTAAISILGLPEDLSQFWHGLARRNQLNVVDDQRKKGRGRRTLLNYDEVEGILSESAGPRRGRRSVSSPSGSSFFSEDADDATEHDVCNCIGDEDIIDSDGSANPSFKQDGQSGYPFMRQDTKASKYQPDLGSDDWKPCAASSDEEGLSIFEDDQDRHLEILDQANSRRQELQLCHDLGWEVSEEAKLGQCEEIDASDEVLRMTHRKVRPDLLGWRDSISRYTESWEVHGQSLEEADFAENRRHTKRRKIEQDTGKQQDLPFRAPRP